jgi:hypothetical protein
MTPKGRSILPQLRHGESDATFVGSDCHGIVPLPGFSVDSAHTK